MDNKNLDPVTYGHREEHSLPMGRQESGEYIAAPEEQRTMLRQAQMVPGGQSMPPRTGNNFGKEVSALMERYPELKEKAGRGEEIPREVMEICARTGVSLRTAYAEYELKQAKAEIEHLRKENQILKQNAAAAAKAPVRGAYAGGNDNKGKDPFLEGLLSDD